MSRFIDIHVEKRKALKLFQAVEPCVELIGSTQMVRGGFLYHNAQAETGLVSTEMGLLHPDEIPGFVARMSHGSTGTAEENVKLTKKLLTFNPAHKTPFEFMQWIFKITGISKSCLTQFDRNRVGIGFVQMSGRFMDSSERGFVYTAYAEKEWENPAPEHDPQPEEDIRTCAKTCLSFDSIHYNQCMEAYNEARVLGQTKQDARKNLPLAIASGTYVYLNSSSLKQFFNERLRPAAEWEIRRMAQMMFDIVYGIAPAHFEAEKELLDGK